MSRESDIKSILIGDATLMAILTGGVFTSADVGRDGITRDSAPGAFDTSGYLKPCALVKERGSVPDNQVVDTIQGHASAGQVVEIWNYEDEGYTNIDAAQARQFVLLFGLQLSGTFPLEWAGTLNREVDEGALSGSSLARQDWLVIEIIGD